MKQLVITLVGGDVVEIGVRDRVYIIREHGVHVKDTGKLVEIPQVYPHKPLVMGLLRNGEATTYNAVQSVIYK